MTIQEIYEAKCNDNSDICQHLPTLKQYAEKCDSIVELGVRSIVSTWSFLAAKPKRLFSVDIQHPESYEEYDPKGCNLKLVYDLAFEQGTSFSFLQADTLKIELKQCDLIFFDTLHTYEQLSKELELHGNKANKYLIFHDTETYGMELLPAISEFMKSNPHWIPEAAFTNNNGLLIIKRV